MRLLSNRDIYHDGRHNAFTSMVLWKGKYWVVFRNGSAHKPEWADHDGRIMVMSSPDLEAWSEPQVIINTALDDRDPTIYVCEGRLFVVSMSIRREPGQPLTKAVGLVVNTSDGWNWTKPQLALPERRVIWWVSPGPDALYGSVYVRMPKDPARINHCPWAELWRSEDGLKWQKVCIISDENRATETALAFLPDNRLFALVRHDEHDMPEIRFASPPYTHWKTATELQFRNNGPSIGLVGNKLVTATRAHFEDPRTPLTDDLCRERLRGMILGVFDPETLEWEPALALPHSRGVAQPSDPDYHMEGGMNRPDVSYASIMDLGDGRFVMIYYEGLKGAPSDIRAAVLTM